MHATLFQRIDPYVRRRKKKDMNRFLRLSSSLALCALLAVPAAAGAARDDFDLSASGISSSGYAQQLGAPKSCGR